MFKRLSKIYNQRGITSVVVVFVLVTLLTLIGIGFTKIMNRSLQSSAASQQASAANYAAQSGVNDVLSYLKTQPATAATKCDDLIKTGAPLASAAKISSDGSTAYTCALVDPSPTSLFYQGLNPYKSQIVKINTSAPLSSLLFSWQSPNRQHNQFVLVTGPGQTLYDEKTWSDKNYAPLLRLTLYPIPASGDLSNAQANSQTYFFYPQTGGSNSTNYNKSGDVTPVNCSSKNLGSFTDSADYDCNVVINNLPSASYFYANFAPYYDQAVVKIKGNDASNQPVQFKNVQSVVDVTAKSGGATKRLQARVDTSASAGGTDFNISSGSDNAPEFALGSADTICKRLIVPSSISTPVAIDAGSAANCQLSLPPPPPPDATTGAASNIEINSATLNGTVNPQGYNVTTCRFDYGTTASYGSSANCSSLPGAGKANVAVSANIASLTAGTTYHFQLVATNANGTNNGGDVTFTSKSPPPVPPSVGSFTYNGLSGTSLSFSYACNNSSSASITVNPNMHGGSSGTQPLSNTNGTSNIGGPYQAGDAGTATLNCINGGQTATQSLNWSIAPPTVHVSISQPTTWYNTEYTRSYKTKSPSIPNDCRDGVHNWAICLSVTADQGGNPADIMGCNVSPSLGWIDNARGQPHRSSQGRWINLQFGWNVTIDPWLNTSPGNNPSMPYDGTVVTVTCFGKIGNPIPSASKTFTAEWRTCADRGEQGLYYSDVAQNGCRPADPPYVPPVVPPPGGGGGGGVCPPGWSGTWPSCGPPLPPGGGGGCGLLDRRRIFPNYGFMSLPIFKFARVIPC